MNTYYTTHTPIVIAAIGPKSSGRMTSMILLSEILWENGYRKLKAFDSANDPNIIGEYARSSNLPLSISDNQKPLILIARCDTLDQYKFISQYPNVILLRVTRETERDIGAWYYSSEINQQLVLPVRNELSLRYLKFILRALFENVISEMKIWKGVYGNKNVDNISSSGVV